VFPFFRRRFTARRSARPICRLTVERLEERATPANIAVVGASLQTATSLRLTYQSAGVTGFEVGIFRSADPVFSADDVPITNATVTPGTTTANQIANIALGGEIPIDPARPYVLAVADPNNAIDESNETDNTGQFRKLALGVVTHGFEPSGRAPAWLHDMADGLRREGFARVIEFDWAASSRIAFPGLATLAGWRMAYQVRLAADALGTRPTDVVDVQFIGHSRGSVVISQALSSLQYYPGPRELRLGYLQMTMLDPHPARNRGWLFSGYAELLNGTGVSNIGGFSFDQTSWFSLDVARGMLSFQAAARDPLVTVPANVDKAEVYYQRLPWFDTLVGGFEYLTGLNPWGESPANLINRSAKPITTVDISQPPIGIAVGHTSVQLWYMDEFLPPPGP
jgi:hypothetical protein